MTAPPARYFAPTFFSPFYFPSLVRDGGAGAAAPPYRDQDAYASIAAALGATGAFAGVFFGVTADTLTAGAGQLPAAVITPDLWFETDDTDPVVIVRRVSFLLTLIVRDDDPVLRFHKLDLLSSLAQNAIDGSDLGGGCLAALTKTRWGRFGTTPAYPEQSVVLHGEFTYLVPGWDGRSTTS